MKIKNTEGMSGDQIIHEIENGARFVVFQYCYSILIMTFKKSSEIHFVRAGESTAGKSILYTLSSLIFGWWGFPWGPIYTVSSVFNNLRGGKNVTTEVLSAFIAVSDDEELAS